MIKDALTLLAATHVPAIQDTRWIQIFIHVQVLYYTVTIGQVNNYAFLPEITFLHAYQNVGLIWRIGAL